MEKLVKKSMRQQIYELLKQRIYTQEYDLGDPLNIVTISKELSISNTPIREAISMLCAEGLVISNLNSKFRVIQLDESTMTELNEATFILLSGAVRLFRSKEDRDKLAVSLENALEAQKEAAKNNDIIEYIHRAIKFDRCFLEITENKKLIEMYDNLSAMLFLSVRYAYQHSNIAQDDNLREHEQLINAVRNSETSDICELLYKHYDKHYDSTSLEKLSDIS